MHRSRFAGIIIDCRTDDLDSAAEFWSAALGYPRSARQGDPGYVSLDAPEREPYVEVQAVDHDSRVHLDIETDDVDAEVARLVALGATEIARVKGWVILEAPTGQRFCVVPVMNRHFEATANHWD